MLGQIASMLRRLGSSRVLFAMFLGFLALAIQNSSLRDSTFLASWDHSAFDDVVRLHRNTVGGPAPPVMLVSFGGAARDAYYAQHPPEGRSKAWTPDEYPDSTPLQVVSETMNAARHMQARVVIIDIDLSLLLAQRSPQEVSAFTTFLTDWANDASAPLAVLVRTELPQLPGDPKPTMAPTPWDAIVGPAANLAWGSSNGDAKINDNVIRNQYLYTCALDGSGKAQPLISAALMAAAAARDGVRGDAKQAAAEALARRPLCTKGNTENAGGASAFLPGPGIELHVGNQVLASQSQRVLIDYHLDDPLNPGAKAGAPLPPGYWADGARAIKPWETGALFNALGPDTGQGSIVILGSSQPLFPDLQWTPYAQVAGSLVLANATRGMALVGPIAIVPWNWQLAGLIIMLLATHYFYRASDRLNRRARAGRRGVLGWLARGLTSPPASKIYALLLVYQAGQWTGALLLDYGYWSSTPFMGASIYILIGDAIEILDGGRIKSGD